MSEPIRYQVFADEMRGEYYLCSDIDQTLKERDAAIDNTIYLLAKCDEKNVALVEEITALSKRVSDIDPIIAEIEEKNARLTADLRQTLDDASEDSKKFNDANYKSFTKITEQQSEITRLRTAFMALCEGLEITLPEILIDKQPELINEVGKKIATAAKLGAPEYHIIATLKEL